MRIRDWDSTRPYGSRHHCRQRVNPADGLNRYAADDVVHAALVLVGPSSLVSCARPHLPLPEGGSVRSGGTAARLRERRPTVPWGGFSEQGGRRAAITARTAGEKCSPRPGPAWDTLCGCTSASPASAAVAGGKQKKKNNDLIQPNPTSPIPSDNARQNGKLKGLNGDIDKGKVHSLFSQLK